MFGLNNVFSYPDNKINPIHFSHRCNSDIKIVYVGTAPPLNFQTLYPFNFCFLNMKGKLHTSGFSSIHFVCFTINRQCHRERKKYFNWWEKNSRLVFPVPLGPDYVQNDGSNVFNEMEEPSLDLIRLHVWAQTCKHRDLHVDLLVLSECSMATRSPSCPRDCLMDWFHCSYCEYHLCGLLLRVGVCVCVCVWSWKEMDISIYIWNLKSCVSFWPYSNDLGTDTRLNIC